MLQRVLCLKTATAFTLSDNDNSRTSSKSLTELRNFQFIDNYIDLSDFVFSILPYAGHLSCDLQEDNKEPNKKETAKKYTTFFINADLVIT